MWCSNIAFNLFNLFLLTLFIVIQKIMLNFFIFLFYCYLNDGPLLKIRPNQIKLYEKPKPTYSLTYYDTTTQV